MDPDTEQAPPTAPARIVDWELVEREYRAGHLSVREIAKAAGVSHTAIQKRAKREEWVQDLAAKVRDAVAAKLVAREVATDVVADKAKVETLAENRVDIIFSHRKDIAKHRRIAAAMLAELETDAEKDEKERMSLKERADISERLSRTSVRLIQLERQAFGLDDDTKAPDSAETVDAASPRGEIERRLARLASPC